MCDVVACGISNQDPTGTIKGNGYSYENEDHVMHVTILVIYHPKNRTLAAINTLDNV